MVRQVNKPSTNEADRQNVHNGLNAILHHEHSDLSYGKLHLSVNNLVINLKTKELEDDITLQVSKHFQEWGEELDKLDGNPLITKYKMDLK